MLSHSPEVLSHARNAHGEFEACILAGGLSSRMGGRDKARLRLDGRTLLQHVRGVARQLGVPVRVIRRDLVPRCGPMGGVFTALKTTRANAVLFLSCDMPLLQASLLRAIVSKLSASAEAVFTQRGTKVGFPFAVRASALPRVAELISKERFSLQSLARHLKAKRVRFPRRTAEQCLLNVNTPEDWQRLRAMRNRSRSGSSYS